MAELTLLPRRGSDEQRSGDTVITFIRHAEALHNQDCRGLSDEEGLQLIQTAAYWDSPLTAAGAEQCSRAAAAAATNWPGMVVSSPLTRALQTASLIYRPSGREAPPFIATELARERISRYTCDGRRERSVLQAEFPLIDFGLLSEADEMWHAKEDQPHEQSSLRCTERASQLLQWLHAREERHIAVVSHSVFLAHLLRLFPQLPADHAGPFHNAELRQFVLRVNVNDRGSVERPPIKATVAPLKTRLWSAATQRRILQDELLGLPLYRRLSDRRDMALLATLEQEFDAFVSDGADATDPDRRIYCLKFAPMAPSDRFLVSSCAVRYHLQAASFGEDADRFVVVYKHPRDAYMLLEYILPMHTCATYAYICTQVRCRLQAPKGCDGACPEAGGLRAGRLLLQPATSAAHRI